MSAGAAFQTRKPHSRCNGADAGRHRSPSVLAMRCRRPPARLRYAASPGSTKHTLSLRLLHWHRQGTDEQSSTAGQKLLVCYSGTMPAGWEGDAEQGQELALLRRFAATAAALMACVHVMTARGEAAFGRPPGACRRV